MTNSKRSGRSRDSVALGGYIAASVLLFLMTELLGSGSGASARTTSLERQRPEDLEALALESCRGISQFEVAEVEISLLRSLKRKLQRAILPDGWVEVWVRCLGEVRAGIELSALTSDDIEVSVDDAGRRSAVLRLPAPQITHRALTDIDWGSSRNLWVWAPERMALEMRQEIRNDAYSELEERAVESGVLEQARSAVAEIAAHALSALRISSVEVILEDDRVLEIGTEPGREVADAGAHTRYLP